MVELRFDTSDKQDRAAWGHASGNGAKGTSIDAARQAMTHANDRALNASIRAGKWSGIRLPKGCPPITLQRSNPA
jgi:hypothetical protein